jgi:hypothetical protein
LLFDTLAGIQTTILRTSAAEPMKRAQMNFRGIYYYVFIAPLIKNLYVFSRRITFIESIVNKEIVVKN